MRLTSLPKLTAALGALALAFACAPAAPAASLHEDDERPRALNLAVESGDRHTDNGVIQAITMSSLTLRLLDGSTMTIAIERKTKIVVDGNDAGLGDLRPGYVAAIAHEGDGPALLVRAENPHELPKPQRQELAGMVTAVGEDAVTILLRDGSTVTVQIGDDTRIVVNGHDADLHDIKPGLAVVAMRDGDGPAAKLKAEGEEEQREETVSGTIHALEGADLVLRLKDGRTVTLRLSHETRIVVNGREARLDDLRAGMGATAKQGGKGAVAALRAEGREEERPTTVSGTVESVGGDGLVLRTKGRSLAVAVAANAEIFVNGRPGRLGDMRGGLRATIRLDRDGLAVAVRAEGREAAREEKTLTGVVRTVANDGLLLRLADGRSVAVVTNDDTRVTLDGREARLRDVQSRYAATVRRSGREAAASVEATSVPNRSASGLVRTVGAGRIVLRLWDGSTITIFVDGTTRVTVNGESASLRKIRPGFVVAAERSGTTRKRPARTVRAAQPGRRL